MLGNYVRTIHIHKKISKRYLGFRLLIALQSEKGATSFLG